MNVFSIQKVTKHSCSFAPAHTSTAPILSSRVGGMRKQRGVVLFLTLIALLAMSLAAVALIRSVDTNTMIAGNIAYKHETTTSADRGIEDAMSMLNAISSSSTLLVYTDANHPLNRTDPVNFRGYHPSIYPALNFKDKNTWTGTAASLDSTDDNGNKVQYIIERMCRTPNVAMQFAECLYNSVSANNGCRGIPGPGCHPGFPGTPAQIRVTIRSESTTGTISFVQGFIF